MFYFVLSSLVVPRERALRTRLTRAHAHDAGRSHSTRSIIDLEDREPCLHTKFLVYERLQLRPIQNMPTVSCVYRVSAPDDRHTNRGVQTMSPCVRGTSNPQTLYSPNKAHPSCL